MKAAGTGAGGWSSGAWQYRWTCHSHDPCPVCEDMDGTVKTLDEWRMSRQPGFHDHCACTLVPVSSTESGGRDANSYCLYPPKREQTHWNTSAGRQIINGGEVAVPSPKVIRPRLPAVKWKQLME